MFFKVIDFTKIWHLPNFFDLPLSSSTSFSSFAHFLLCYVQIPACMFKKINKNKSQPQSTHSIAKGKFHYEALSNSSLQDVLLHLPLQFRGRVAQLPRKYSQLKAADWTPGRIIDLVLSNIAADTSFGLPIN